MDIILSYLFSQLDISLMLHQVMDNSDLILRHCALEGSYQILLGHAQRHHIKGVQVHHGVGAPAVERGQGGPTAGLLGGYDYVAAGLVIRAYVDEVCEQHRDVD